MIRFSEQRLAQVSVAVLLLVIIRSLGEYFRLQYLHGDALALAQVTPYVAGALFAAVALAASLTCYLAHFYRVSIAIAAAVLVTLFVYKVAIVG
jgi:hypothetical protein